jgi:hypothetical protein
MLSFHFPFFFLFSLSTVSLLLCCQRQGRAGTMPKVQTYKALYAFQAQEADELSLMAGDLVCSRPHTPPPQKKKKKRKKKKEKNDMEDADERMFFFLYRLTKPSRTLATGGVGASRRTQKEGSFPWSQCGAAEDAAGTRINQLEKENNEERKVERIKKDWR